MCLGRLSATSTPNISFVSLKFTVLLLLLSMIQSVSCGSHVESKGLQKLISCRLITSDYFQRLLVRSVQGFKRYFTNRQTVLTVTVKAKFLIKHVMQCGLLKECIQDNGQLLSLQISAQYLQNWMS